MRYPKQAEQHHNVTTDTDDTNTRKHSKAPWPKLQANRSHGTITCSAQWKQHTGLDPDSPLNVLQQSASYAANTYQALLT
jgi:hypothetical protein